jgi:hypothetical protein
MSSDSDILLPRCPVCGNPALLELCEPGGVALCPLCGCLLAWFRKRFGPGIDLDRAIAELGLDSLDIVELMMELEEETGVAIPDRVAERVRTVGGLIRHVSLHGGRVERIG